MSGTRSPGTAPAVFCLRDVAELVRGVAYKPTDLRTVHDPDGVALLRATNIQDGRLETSDVQYVARERVASRQELQQWDVLIAMSSGSKLAVGKLAQLASPWSGTFGAFCAVMRPNPELVDPAYFGFLLRTPAFRERIELMAQGTNIKNLSKEHLLGFPVALPSLLEQRRIGRILSTIEQAREKTAQVVAATARTRDAMLQSLLADMTPSVKIGDIGVVKGGKRLPKGHVFAPGETPYPYIRVIDFADGSVRTTNLRYLEPEDRARIARYVIAQEDVYISIAGTIGLVGVIPAELDGANLTENAARIVIGDATVNHRFLAWYLRSPMGQEQIRVRTTKTSQPKLALMRIADISLPVPPLAQQSEIASALDLITQKLHVEHGAKHAQDRVFQAALTALLGAAA